MENIFFNLKLLLVSFLVKTFATANSISAKNTNIRHVDIQMSMAFVYDTCGRDAFTPELCVVMVSTVKTPSEIRPGTALTFSQKEIQDNITTRTLGMYICTR